MLSNGLISRCCEGCSHLVREKCEKAYIKSESENFIYCDTQKIRLLIEVAT
jgi:hypothetical protein